MTHEATRSHGSRSSPRWTGRKPIYSRRKSDEAHRTPGGSAVTWSSASKGRGGRAASWWFAGRLPAKQASRTRHTRTKIPPGTRRRRRCPTGFSSSCRRSSVCRSSSRFKRFQDQDANTLSLSVRLSVGLSVRPLSRVDAQRKLISWNAVPPDGPTAQIPHPNVLCYWRSARLNSI